MFSIKLSLNRPRNVLTQREEEVLLELMLGKSNTEIAQDLIISNHTAKAHVCSILQKLGLDRRSNVILEALYNGWVEVMPN